MKEVHQEQRDRARIRHELPASGLLFILPGTQEKGRAGKKVGNEIYLPCTDENRYIRIVHNDGRISRVHPLGKLYQDDEYIPDPNIEDLMMPDIPFRAEQRRR